MNGTPEKILIADDHPLIREALTETFASFQPAYDITTAANGYAVLLALESNPDTALVLLDLYMPGPSGFALLATLQERFPQVKVVVLTASEDPKDRFKARHLGAAAYVAKSTPSQTLVAIVRRVLKVKPVFPGKETSIKDDFEKSREHERTGRTESKRLTKRQQEILELVAAGFSNKEIARHLNLSTNTIKSHVSAIFRALGVHNRTQVAIVARNLHLWTSHHQTGEGED